MYRYGKHSIHQLASADSRWQLILKVVITIMDISIIESHRGKEKQNKYFKEGKSKVKFPFGKHNLVPSLAVDLCPYRNGLRWKDKESFYFLAGVINGIAAETGIKIRWGGDWDSDNDFYDQTFFDLCHFEIVEDKNESS